MSTTISAAAGTATAAKLVQNNNGERITGQRFAMEPQDQTAIVGSRVTLPCRVIEKQGTLQVSKKHTRSREIKSVKVLHCNSCVGVDE